MASFIRGFLTKMKYGDPIIVVSGLPRSGTSMCMKMLEAGGVDVVQDGIRSADEDNPKGYFEHERVKDLDKGGDKSWVKNARGQAIKVISFLLPHLPSDNRYQVVFVRREYQEVLASTQVACLPCRISDDQDRDVCPLTLQEAMACGVPVVSCDIHSIPELVRDECGGLVPPEDVDALAETLVKLLTSAEERRLAGEAGRKVVEDEFNISTQVALLVDHWKLLLAKGK